MQAIVLVVLVVVASAFAPRIGCSQEPPASFSAIVSAMGYSPGGEVIVHQAGTFVGASADWYGDLPFVSKFLVPPSTYEVEIAGELFVLELSEPDDEQVLEIKLMTDADGRYTTSVAILDQTLAEWQDKTGCKVAAGTTYKLEELTDELVIEFEPKHPLLGLGRLSPEEQEDVLAALEERRSVIPDSYTLRVKDMRPPPSRPSPPSDETHERPQ